MEGFNEDNFKSYIQTTNWDELMNYDHGDINHSFDSLLDKFNTILNKHALLKPSGALRLLPLDHQRPNPL